MSTDPLYFFSYSRQELYFAEAAVLALQRDGLNIWFDLQQLEPGCNWSEEIQHGLEACAGVILLASYASLNSPWVALEWEHALQHGKPVYVLLFEAVKFDAIPASEATNQQPIPLDQLQQQAAAILDVRRQFQKNMTRVSGVIKSGGHTHDPVPQPNRWRIPTVMPAAIAFVTFSLALMTAVMLWVSLYGFSIYWPMMLGGLLITGWLGSRTMAFLRRRSFREARAILPVALVISPFIWLVLTPVLALGTVLILRSADVQRWSPLGQGIDRNRYQALIPRNETPPHNGFERLARGYIHSLRAFRWIVFLIVLLLNLGVALPAAVDRSFALWMLVLPLLMVLLIAFEFVGRRLMQPVPSGKRYTVVAAPEDRAVALQVNQQMRRAGHTPVAETAEPKADFVIVVLSNYTSDAILERYAQPDQKVICVTASALDDWGRYKSLARFQWVDYRRQQVNRLAAMALDILNIGEHSRGHSFSTQLTPESFAKTVLPTRAASGIGCMYLMIYIVASLMVVTLLNPISSQLTLFTVITNLPLILVYVWLMIGITRREISLWTLVLVGVILALLSTTIGSVLGVSIYQIGWVYRIAAVILLNVVVYYLIYRITVGSWLPARPFMLPRLALRRNRDQWALHLGLVVLIILLSFVFLNQRYDYATTIPTSGLRPVSYTDQLTVNVPAYWYPANSADNIAAETRTQVLARALGRVSLTFGDSAVKTFNQFLNGGVAPVLIPGDPIEHDADAMGLQRVEDDRYIPDAAQLARTLRFDLWAYPKGFLYPGEGRVFF